METLLILAAAAIAVLALAFAWAVSARAARPPLRTRQEAEMIGDDREALIAAMTPAEPSPIDRSAPILEISAIEAALVEGRFLEGPDGRSRTEGRMIEDGVIEGKVIEGRIVEDEAQARPWNAMETDGPGAPHAAPAGRKVR